MGASNFELVFISSTWDCTTFHNFLPMFKKKIQKLAGLWLAGEVVNHVGIYGSKAAEGLSAFQRRSCLYLPRQWEMMLHCNIVSHWLEGAYTKWSLFYEACYEALVVSAFFYNPYFLFLRGGEMAAMQYLLIHDSSLMCRCCHSWVSMGVADGLDPFWYHNICSHCDDLWGCIAPTDPSNISPN